MIDSICIWTGYIFYSLVLLWLTWQIIHRLFYIFMIYVRLILIPDKFINKEKSKIKYFLAIPKHGLEVYLEYYNNRFESSLYCYTDDGDKYYIIKDID